MRLPLKREFPGGKLETNESPEAGLQREIKEELNVEIMVGKPLTQVNHQYPATKLILLPFLANIIQGDIKLMEHKAYIWQPKSLLSNLDWAGADQPVVQQLLTL